MADVTIGSLPGVTSLDDSSLIPAEQQGDSVKITGAQFKEFAQNAVSSYVSQASTQAQAAANSASQAAESASEAQTAVGQIGTAVEDTQSAQAAAEAAQAAAESAQDAAETAQGQAQTAANQAGQSATAAGNAQTAAEAAQDAAEDARDLAEGYSTSASGSASTATQMATQAGESATAATGSASTASQAASAAQEAKTDAEIARAGAETARAAIENLGVAGETLDPGQSVDVEKGVSEQGIVTLTFRIPRGAQGVGITNITVDENGDLIVTLDNQQTIEAGHVKGEPGDSVTSTQRISGTGAPGTTDTWGMYNQKGTQVGTFTTYNGQDGIGSGDMKKSVYDSNNMNQDVFAYVDSKIQALRQEILSENFFVVQPEGE